MILNWLICVRKMGFRLGWEGQAGRKTPNSRLKKTKIKSFIYFSNIGK